MADSRGTKSTLNSPANRSSSAPAAKKESAGTPLTARSISESRPNSPRARDLQSWAVVDVFRGELRRWSEPPLDGVFAPLLAPGERVGKQYDQGIEVKAGALELAWLVYRQGEPNCCPTGGVVKVRLSAGKGN